jgi:hypothetical protein
MLTTFAPESTAQSAAPATSGTLSAIGEALEEGSENQQGQRGREISHIEDERMERRLALKMETGPLFPNGWAMCLS